MRSGGDFSVKELTFRRKLCLPGRLRGCSLHAAPAFFAAVRLSRCVKGKARSGVIGDRGEEIDRHDVQLCSVRSPRTCCPSPSRFSPCWEAGLVNRKSETRGPMRHCPLASCLRWREGPQVEMRDVLPPESLPDRVSPPLPCRSLCPVPVSPLSTRLQPSQVHILLEPACRCVECLFASQCLDWLLLGARRARPPCLCQLANTSGSVLTPTGTPLRLRVVS